MCKITTRYFIPRAALYERVRALTLNDRKQIHTARTTKIVQAARELPIRGLSDRYTPRLFDYKYLVFIVLTLIFSQTTLAQPLIPLINGGVISDAISVPGEIDSYTFTAAAGESVQIRVADTSGNDFFPRLDLYDPSGAFVAADNGTNVAVINRSITVAGTYTLVVSDDSFGNDAIGDYDLFFRGIGGNPPPVLSEIGNKFVNEGELLEFVITATDPNNNNLTFSLSNSPTGATLTPNADGVSATFSWTPNIGQAGNYPDVLFTVTDDGVPIGSDSEAITITVGPFNPPPEFDPLDNQFTNVGEELSFTVRATDPEGDAITLTVSNAPTGATFTDNGDGTGTFTWTPNIGQDGNYTVSFTATDDGTPPQSDTLEVTITVDGNQPPVLSMIGDRTVDEGELLEFTLTANDPDGNTHLLQ